MSLTFGPYEPVTINTFEGSTPEIVSCKKEMGVKGVDTRLVQLDLLKIPRVVETNDLEHMSLCTYVSTDTFLLCW